MQVGELMNLDTIASQDSPIHNIDGCIKLISALLIIVFTVVSNQLIIPIILEIYILILIYLSKIPYKLSFKRLICLLPFGGFIILFQPFIHPGNVLWTGIWGLQITDTGLNWSILLLSRLIVCLSTIILLSSTSPLHEIMESFRKLKMPKEIAMIISIMVRFLFLFFEELETIQEAQKSRNFDMHNKEIEYSWRLKQVGYTVAMMFMKAYGKGEKIYLSMASRGFSDDSELYTTRSELNKSDYTYIITTIVIIIALEIITLTLSSKLGYLGLPLNL